ncbi:Cytidylate kinase, partial [Dissostichus eleginoides]
QRPIVSKPQKAAQCWVIDGTAQPGSSATANLTSAGDSSWLVGAGSRYRGRDWRKPICLAEKNGPGPGVNQQTQHTAHS